VLRVVRIALPCSGLPCICVQITIAESEAASAYLTRAAILIMIRLRAAIPRPRDRLVSRSAGRVDINNDKKKKVQPDTLRGHNERDIGGKEGNRGS